MKQRTKRHRPAQMALKSKLLFVVRIQGWVARSLKCLTLVHISSSTSNSEFSLSLSRKNDMHPVTKKILNKLRLRRIFSGVLIKANEAVMDMLRKVEPYVTYG